MATRKHYDQGNLMRKLFISGLAYKLLHDHNGCMLHPTMNACWQEGRHGTGAVIEHSHLIYKLQRVEVGRSGERERLDLLWPFETSKHTPSDTATPRLHLLQQSQPPNPSQIMPLNGESTI